MEFPLDSQVTRNGSVRSPLTLSLLVALLASFGLAFALSDHALASKTVTIYKSELNTADRQASVTKYNGPGTSCSRQPRPTAIRIGVGRSTRECFMRIPVVGKSLEVTASGRLFSSTPKAIRSRTYLGLSVRQSGNGARYQLAVFPAAKKFQLRKVLPDGTIRYFAAGKAGKSIKGLGETNRMTLRVFNGVGKSPASTARLVASVNGKRLAFADDSEGSSLTGTTATFSIGSPKVADGARGSFSSLVARIPDPFA